MAISLFMAFWISYFTMQPEIVRIDDSTITPEELDARINTLIHEAKVTGIAVGILNNNQIAYNKAFGLANSKTKEALQTDDGFYGTSLSKSVFGYMVAVLAENETIDLDKPLQDYLAVPIPDLVFEKEWRGFSDLADDKRYEDITARMCLSHTTGLPNWRWISREGEFTPEGKLKIYSDPGTRYSYSGEGMMLLQYVLEKITDKGLEEMAQEIVFKPLDMHMTSYIWQERFEGEFCLGHTTAGEVIPKDRADETAAAGSMETTPDDYLKFMSHILSLASEGSPITKLMFSPNIRIRSQAQFGPFSLKYSDDNAKIDLSYGLGWGLLQSPYGPGAFKEGHGEGFQHYSIIFPEKEIGILLMSNSDNAESIFKELLEISIGDVYTPWKWENYIPYDKS